MDLYFYKPKRTNKKIFVVLFMVWIVWGLWSLVYEANKPKKNEVFVSETQAETPKVETIEQPQKPQAEPSVYQKYFGDKASEAELVAKCESKLNSQAVGKNKNGTMDTGLFQINSIWHKEFGITAEQLLSADFNAEIAKKIFDKTGNWSAWYSSKDCHKLN